MKLTDVLIHYPKRAFVMCSFVALVVTLNFSSERSSDMKVAFLDIGQGDSVLVTTGDGVRMLYDAGPKDGPILQRLGEEIPFWVHDIDICIPSHPDADHLGGFVNVLTRYRCKKWLDGHTMDGTMTFREIESALASSSRMTIERGSRIDLGSEVVADVLDPAGEETNAWRTVDTNARSVVLRVSYGSSSVFLSGDLPIEQENELARGYGSQLHSTIFKAGHHGSKTSSGSLLLAQVAPVFAVLSYGSHNRYGHPHAEAVKRIEATGAEIHATAKEGTIHFSCDEEKCHLDN